MWISSRYLPITTCCLLLLAATSCTHTKPSPTGSNTHSPFTGTTFYKQAAGYGWQQRDSLALAWLLGGHTPPFMQRFAKVHTYHTDSSTGQKIHGWYYVTPDYLSIGTATDWARIPLTPMAAQQVADKLGCFLPTRKMVNDIYQQATVQLEPIPMFAFRDSTPTMWHHHLIIEGQRQGRKGLIAGIKKDVVISSKVHTDNRPNRVAIYGWHKPNGQPIQPLYTGHVNWYVDYSHGIRLVQQTIFVQGKAMHYAEVLRHPIYRHLLCDEADCSMISY